MYCNVTINAKPFCTKGEGGKETINPELKSQHLVTGRDKRENQAPVWKVGVDFLNKVGENWHGCKMSRGSVRGIGRLQRCALGQALHQDPHMKSDLQCA